MIVLNKCNLKQNMEEDLIYDIKTLSTNDIIIFFRTVEINIESAEYIYIAMSNPYVYEFIDQLVEMYIEKKVYSVFYEIMDGWLDNKHIFTKNYKEKLYEKLYKIFVILLRTDMIKCDNFYIDKLQNEFNINYYAETMVG
jgi:hypothetical protein